MVSLALLAAVLAAVGCSQPETFRGTELTANAAAPGFELVDQAGRRTGPSDHEGSVVMLTFLYTHCPDICPIVANHVRDAADLLQDASGEVSVIAVSVDPEGDTVEAALDYSKRWRMEDRWSYLVGSEEELRPVWAAYYLDPVRLDADSDGEHDETSGVDALYEGAELRYTVTHSAPVYLIDRQGLLRVLFTLPMDPKDIAHDVRLLLAE